MSETDLTNRKSKIDTGDSAPPWLTVESVTRTSPKRAQPARAKQLAPDEAYCLLHQAAHDYVDLGLPITLCPAGSKVPFSKDWGNKVWAHDEIDAEFDGRGPLAVGLILGPKSRLIDIEVDGPDGDAALLKLFEGDVPVTPMWRSARGDHRLFQWHEDLAQIGKASVTFDDLEIRLGAGGKAAQSLLPPSETEGWGRQWVISLDECDPAPLPRSVRQQLVAMFGQKSCAMPVEEGMRHSIAVFHNAVSHAVSHPQSKEETGLSSARGDTPARTHGADRSLVLPGYSTSVQAAIRRAIGNTLPGSEGFRNKLLLQLARLLKGIPALASLAPDELEPVVREWHRQALPSIATKDFNVTWHDFVVAWGNVKFPGGTGPLEDIYVAGLARMPAIASRYKAKGVRNLIALCRQLQAVKGDKPFWLACRAAATVVGTSPATANRWLWLLIHNKVLELVKEGSRGHAAEYRYRGD